ncbi:MAG: DivIVA domain-containing protein [bacterium]|nr:DivIVA domain-containing protein [bacterium]
MDLSPNDIRNYEFSSQMRGYDKDAVDSFLDQVADSLDQLKQENLKLSLEVDSINKQLTNLKQFEDTIKSAAIDARRHADETVAKAKEEAAAILEVANKKAVELVGSRAEQVETLDNQLSKLEMVRNSYLTKLQELIQSHMEIVREIESVQSEREELPQMDLSPDQANSTDSIEVTDSSEVDGSKLETIATKPSETARKSEEEAHESGDIIGAHPEETPVAETECSEQTVDPELAKAIQSYKAEEDFSDTPEIDQDILEPKSPEAAPPAAPEPGQWVETNRRAEDIPEGFISQGGMAADDPRRTGQNPVPTPNNEFGNDTSKVENKSTEVDPNAIASELDAVAAKFEEEMTKAEQN